MFLNIFYNVFVFVIRNENLRIFSGSVTTAHLFYKPILEYEVLQEYSLT